MDIFTWAIFWEWPTHQGGTLDDYSSTLVIVAGLAFLLAVITGSLSAVSSVRWSALEKMGEEGKNLKARRALRFLERNEDRVISGLGAVYLITAITTGIMLMRWVNIAFPGGSSHTLTILVGAVVIIVGLGESLPRYIARSRPESATILLHPAIQLTTIITKPFSDLFEWIFTPITRRLNRGRNNNVKITEDEIIRIVEEGGQLGVLEAGEKEMIHSILEFTDTIVREVMVPRVDMVGIEEKASITDAIGIMVESGFSRLPVYRESLDHILGILYTKDVLPLLVRGELESTAGQVARSSVFFVPDKKPVNQLLQEMQKRSISIAVVVDEYGGTDGLVTIEDILEEIVGEITDEYDEEQPAISPAGENIWKVDGSTIIEDVNEELDINVPADDHETISGFVCGSLGHIPEKGESMSLEDLGIDIEVLETENQRILNLQITKHPRPTESDDEEE